LGLQALRLASAIVLPFNTTNYAFELDYYLSKSVNFQVPRDLLTTFDRVEELVASSSISLNLTPLRAAIKTLQFASLELDVEKLNAERALKLLLRKWQKHHQRGHERKDGFFRCLMRRLGGFFGVTEKHEPPAQTEEQLEKNGADTGMHQNDDDSEVEGGGHWPHLPIPRRPKHPHWPHWPPHKPRHPPYELIKAVKAVRKINRKLASFERGFIHEDGIKDREWFRHLGVAPGKWLGMGLYGVDVGCRG